MSVSRPYKFMSSYHYPTPQLANLAYYRAFPAVGKPGCRDTATHRECWDQTGRITSRTPKNTTSTAGKDPKVAAGGGAFKLGRAVGSSKAPGTAGVTAKKIDTAIPKTTVNPVSGCGNCNTKAGLDWIACEAGKVSCEVDAAVGGSSNAVQNNLRTAYHKDVTAIGEAGKAVTDAANSTGKFIGDVLGGNANAIQDIFGEGFDGFIKWLQGNWMIPAVVVGGILVILLVVRR